ncbi:hypothetical protein [Burkholderia pseudomallei]|uniref:hypothetical protein n=1 Tax=Burkholderia pseudomallei TaxID=28450 RepID=UPI0012B1494D|nr:hypothetical protein [Burkholderia pseudomallei]
MPARQRLKTASDIYHRSEHGGSPPLRPRNPAPTNLSSGAVMPAYPSSFDYLIAYAIVFTAGVLTSVGLRQYTGKIRRAATAHA